MPKTETIQVLGRGTNVDFTIDDSVPFELAERSLREYLMACRGLYSRGTVSINVGRRILAPDQMSTIRGILNQETGLTVSRYWCSPDVLRKALAGPESRRALPPPDLEYARNPSPARPPIVSAKAGTPLAQVPAAPEGDPARHEEHSATVPFPGRGGFQTRPVQQLSMVFPELDQAQGDSLSVQIPIVVMERDSGSAVDLEAGRERPNGASAESADWGVSQQSAMPAPEPLTGDEDGKEGKAAQGAKSEEPSAEPEDDAWPPADAWPAPNDHALLIKHTCRSGEVVKHTGDVVVYGDVNPGAEIVAGGDIVVLGALRGMAHAGAEGNSKATIFALKLESHRLQIGSHVGEAPRAAGKSKRNARSVNPQIAYLRRRTIYVAPFTQRREEYGGGTPYEG